MSEHDWMVAWERRKVDACKTKYPNSFRCCLVPRRLLFKTCAQRKVGRRQRATRRFACRLYPSLGPLRFINSSHARLCHAKNEAPEEEAGLDVHSKATSTLRENKFLEPKMKTLKFFKKQIQMQRKYSGLGL